MRKFEAKNLFSKNRKNDDVIFADLETKVETCLGYSLDYSEIIIQFNMTRMCRQEGSSFESWPHKAHFLHGKEFPEIFCF